MAAEEGVSSAQVLRSVAEAMAADLDVRDVVQRVAELVTVVTASDVCFVHRVDDDRRRLVLAGATPPFDDLAGTIELAWGEGVAGWVAMHGQPAVIPDKWSDLRYRYIPALRGEDYASLVSVPMIRRGSRVVGVLNVHSRRQQEYSEADVALLTDVANLLAATLENALLHERLAAREATLERFAARMIEAQEGERRRLAGDVHDGISQRLLGLWYHLDAAASAPGTAEAAGELAAARELAGAALGEARAAIAALRPPVLDDLGLEAALRGLGGSVPGAQVEVDLQPCPLAPHVELTLYRIAQEALNNAAKHAEATQVLVQLYPRGEEAVLVVGDDGAGFDPSLPASRHSYGLLGMGERAEMVGGTLTIRSRPGQGTKLTVVVPALAPGSGT